MAYPSKKQTGNNRYLNVSGLSGRGRGRGRFGGCGRGCGCGQGCGNQRGEDKCFCNGVNISDLTCSFTDKEYERLPGYIRGKIYEARQEKTGNKRQNENEHQEDRKHRSVSEVTANKEVETNNNNDEQNNNKKNNEVKNANEKGAQLIWP